MNFENYDEKFKELKSQPKMSLKEFKLWLRAKEGNKVSMGYYPNQYSEYCEVYSKK